MKTPPLDGSSIPRALFSCSNKCCAQETSYPADMLYWDGVGSRWVCEFCWDDLPAPTDEDDKLTRGVTLAEYIIGGDFKAVQLLTSRP